MWLLIAQQAPVDTASRAMAYIFAGAILVACCCGAYIWYRNRTEQRSPRSRRSVRSQNKQRNNVQQRRPTPERRGIAASVNRASASNDTVTLSARQFAEMQAVIREAMPILEAHDRGELVRVQDSNREATTLDEDGPVQLLDPRELTRTMIARLPKQVSLLHLRPTQDAIPFLSDGQTHETISLLAGKHIGIFGASQNGKGNLVQLLAISAMELGPEQTSVWILDPKSGVDYRDIAMYCSHARLYANVPDADGSLNDGFEAVTTEMYARYKQFQTLRPVARNLREYNLRADVPMTAMMVIVDEVKMLDTNQRKKLDNLAQMAAASGITLVIATTYPTADHLGSLVQANMKVRIVFGFPNGKYSEVALGLERGEDHLYEPGAISEPGVAIVRYEGGREVLGRVPHVTDRLLNEAITVLPRRYPRPAVATPANDDAQKLSTVSGGSSEPNPFLGALLSVKSAGESAGETPDRQIDVSPGISPAISATGTDFSRFTVPLPPDEIARIVSLVFAGETKTAIVLGIKGRNTKNHRRYADFFNSVYNQLVVDGFGPLIEAARQRRKEAGIISDEPVQNEQEQVVETE